MRTLTQRVPGFVGCLMLSLLTGAVFFPLSARGQNAADALRYTERFPGVGVRMMGMAGAGIAGTGDVGALFTNPAGLAYMDESILAGGLSTIVAEDDATYNLGQIESLSNGRGSKTAPASLNFFYKVPTTRGSLVVGGGYNQTQSFVRTLNFRGENESSSITDTFLPFEGEYEVTDDGSIEWSHDLPYLAYEAWAINFDQTAYNNGFYPFYSSVANLPITQEGELVEEGRVGELSLGAAVEAFKNGITGLSLNIVTGSYSYDRIFTEIDDENISSGNGRSFDKLEYVTTYQTDLLGLNLRGGVSTKLTDVVRFGVVMETPTYYSASEVYSEEMRTYFDDGSVEQAGGDDSEVASGNYDYNIRTPWRFGVGSSINLSGFQLAVDVSYVDWSQMRLDSEYDDYDEVNRNLRSNYSAVWPYRIGAEYNLGPVSVRGGYAVQQYPRRDQQRIDRNRVYYTGGLGYAVSRDLDIEISWLHERFHDREVPYTDPDIQNLPTVAEDISRNFVTLGVKVRL